MSVLQPDELNLLEDGLQLWLITLRNAPAPQPELLDLFPNLAIVMERSTGEVWCCYTDDLKYISSERLKHAMRFTVACTLKSVSLMRAEHIQTATQIITSCVLLGGPDFMSRHAATIVGILCILLGNVKERGMLLLLPVMGLLLCSYPEHMPGFMEPALQRLLHLLLSDQEPSQVIAGGQSSLIKYPGCAAKWCALHGWVIEVRGWNVLCWGGYSDVRRESE